MMEVNRNPQAGLAEASAAPNWAAWLDENGSRLLLFARQQCRSEADAEDVLQDALVQLVRAVESASFQGGEKLWLSYVYTAIRHLAADRGRHQEVCKNYQEKLQAGMEEAQDDAPWLTSTADQDYLCKRVEALLRDLPKIYAEVVVLKIWGEHTFQEIADLLGEKLPTVSSRYRYAMKALRQALEDNPLDN